MGLADFATVKHKDDVPGPGTYGDLSTIGKVPAITIKGRYSGGAKAGSTNEDVGPGKYDVRGAFARAGAGFTMGAPTNSSAMRSAETTLGPKYSPKQYEMSKAPSSPRFTLSSKPAHWGALTITNTPGPIYNITSTFAPVTKRKVSPLKSDLIETAKKKEDADIPGPGAYTVPRFGDNVPQPRNVPDQHTSAIPKPPQPGPGSYDIVQHTIAKATAPRLHTTKPTFGTRAFPPLPQPCGLPGPAAYNVVPPAGSSSRSARILSRHDEVSELESIYPRPGPGEYHVPSVFESAESKRWYIGQKVEPPKTKLVVPGPGAYEPPQFSISSQIANSASGIRFNGKQTFDPQSHVSPRAQKTARLSAIGPGSYDPKSTARPAHAFTMSPRLPLPAANEAAHFPGPGTYNIKDPDKAVRGPTFCKGAFEVPPLALEPGPGHYSPQEPAKNRTNHIICAPLATAQSP